MQISESSPVRHRHSTTEPPNQVSLILHATKEIKEKLKRKKNVEQYMIGPWGQSAVRSMTGRLGGKVSFSGRLYVVRNDVEKIALIINSHHSPAYAPSSI